MVEAGEYSPYEECIKVYVDVTKQYEDEGAIRCCPQSRDLHVVLCNEVVSALNCPFWPKCPV